MSKLQERYVEWRKTQHGIEITGVAARMAAALVLRGFRQYSIRAIVHVIRFHRDIKSGSDKDGYKVNNSYTPYLARELMATGGLPEGFFETRVVKHERGTTQDLFNDLLIIFKET